ncbi:uncharacterized protein LOC114359497, partial [Ostrinia furnacalis]|uniref:uncharacterized protein LOC114359497 n=1 Tax=Ostrinia furnacalis TaxID=93504 RepID=UPI00103E9986
VREAKGPVQFESEPVGYEGSLPGAYCCGLFHVDVVVREAKGAVQFEGEPVGYEGSLPGTSDDGETCARVRPLRRDTFKKRKLLQMHNLHLATSKAAKPSDIRCSCEYKVESCGVCTGRAEPLQPAPPASTLPPAVRVARVAPGYHPVLSDAQ